MWSEAKQKNRRRSPIKARPLRNPGQSIGEEIVDRVFDRVVFPVMIVIMFATYAGFEWWRWYFDAPPRPLVWSGIAIVALCYCAYSLRKEWRYLPNLKQGRDGEEAVGQFLETLRNQGAQVLHDYPGEGFNLDHIVVHRGGVYVVETKTYSKPASGDARIYFDGNTVLVDGHAPERDPVLQVRAGARWTAQLIRELTGRSFAVHPVLAFPGWFVEAGDAAADSDVLAVEPKMLPAILWSAKPLIDAADVRMISGHLSRSARARLRD